MRLVAGGPGSAFSFVHAADPNDAATNSEQSFDPTTAFKVDDAQDGSGSYAAQYAEQLANDPGYQVEPPPEASGVASGFGFLNKSTRPSRFSRSVRPLRSPCKKSKKKHHATKKQAARLRTPVNNFE